MIFIFLSYVTKWFFRADYNNFLVFFFFSSLYSKNNEQLMPVMLITLMSLQGREQDDGEPESKKATLEEATQDKHRLVRCTSHRKQTPVIF